MATNRSVLLLSSLWIFLIAAPAAAVISSSERDALIAFYNGTNGPNWFGRDNWLGAPGTECTWFGVTCDAQRTFVTQLLLDNNNLAGPFPTSLANLTRLESLRLPRNRLSGAIPAVLGTLSNMRDLNLEVNDLSGTIPPELGGLTRLERLFLGYNDIAGTLPTELTRLTALQSLSLARTLLTGPIPDSVGNLVNLTSLDLDQTSFSGAIPTSVLNLEKLESLAIGGADGNAVFERIAELPNLTTLRLSGTQLRGRIPPAIEQLQRLTSLHLENNELDGSIPPGLGNLRALRSLDLSRNALTGDIPESLGQLTELGFLALSFNPLNAGPIPSWVGNLRNLEWLILGGTNRTGAIPREIGNLTQLRFLLLFPNRLSGALPIEITGLSGLTWLVLGYNELSGSIPGELSRLSNLEILHLPFNQFSGSIPPQLGQLTRLHTLSLDSNLLTGAIPREIGQIPSLTSLSLSANALRGEVPSEITNLTAVTGTLDRNALVASDPAVREFLSRNFGRWDQSQTVPPTDVTAETRSAFAVDVAWTPIRFFGAGGYQVSVSTNRGGPYVPLVTTASKALRNVTVTGLQPATTYFAIVRTISFAEGTQKNTIFSEPTPEFSFTTAALTQSPAQLFVDVLPLPIGQEPNTGGGTTTYRLTNIGGTDTPVTLEEQGGLFVQSPSSFTLAPGQSQSVTVTGTPQPAGSFVGSAVIRFNAGAITLRVQLLSAVPPTGVPRLTTTTYRVDITTEPNVTTTGSFLATNEGDAPFVGVLAADVEWIIPPAALIRIDPGATETITFSVDPSSRPDPSLLTGTVTGTVSLRSIFIPFSGLRAFNSTTPPSVTVNVSLTTAAKPVSGAIPPLGLNEIALFVPAIGRVQGVAGLFLSDLSVANAFGTRPVSDIRLFFKPPATSTALIAAVGDLPAVQSVLIADVARNVFQTEGTVGSLQIRSASIEQLRLNANILNVSNPAGTYGTAIPVFRSDRSASQGDRIYLTGLTRTPTSYSNLFLQETSGFSGEALIEFFDAAGSNLGSRNVAVGRFELIQINDVVPPGGVMARITPSGSARLAAYSTPVDVASGDNWAVADWRRQNAYDPSEPVVIAVAGAAAGANDTFFRTDVAITNIECLSNKQREDGVCGTTDVFLTYRLNGGGTIERTITLEPFQTAILDDIVTTVFQAPSSIGSIVIAPRLGNLAVTSRTYNTPRGGNATFGTAVPALAVSSGIRSGQSKRFASLDDASTAIVASQAPATYRTNFGIVEVSGEPVSVRVTVSYSEPRGKVVASVASSREFQVEGGQALLLPLSSTIFGERREELGYLRNLRLQVDVISEKGSVIVFTSSVDNGTGDAILRIE